MSTILIPENPMERNVLAAIRTLGQNGHSIYIARPVQNRFNVMTILNGLFK